MKIINENINFSIFLLWLFYFHILKCIPQFEKMYIFPYQNVSYKLPLRIHFSTIITFKYITNISVSGRVIYIT